MSPENWTAHLDSCSRHRISLLPAGSVLSSEAQGQGGESQHEPDHRRLGDGGDGQVGDVEAEGITVDEVAIVICERGTDATTSRCEVSDIKYGRFDIRGIPEL
jgi:hypothetical protein